MRRHRWGGGGRPARAPVLCGERGPEAQHRFWRGGGEPLWIRPPRGSGSPFPSDGPGDGGEGLRWKSGATAAIKEGTIFIK